MHPRKRFGQRSIDYRHYLAELARKPQAVRQGLPDLLRDLGEPFPAIWISCTRRTGRVRPRDSSPRSSVSSRRTGRGRRPCVTRGAGDGDAAVAGAHTSARHGGAPSRRRWCPRGCATSTWRAAVPPTTMAGSSGGVGMSAATLARDLIVAQTRALKLPGRRAHL